MDPATYLCDWLRLHRAGAGPACDGLWPWIDGAAAGPIRRLVRCRRIDPSLSDDIRQDLFLYLRDRDWRPIRAFRGSSEPELRRYVGVIAAHFAARRLRRWRRAGEREAEALRRRPRLDRDGPVESHVRFLLEEGMVPLPEGDRAYLVGLLLAGGPADGSAPPARRRSERTLRRWSKALDLHLADGLL